MAEEAVDEVAFAADEAMANFASTEDGAMTKVASTADEVDAMAPPLCDHYTSLEEQCALDAFH